MINEAISRMALDLKEFQSSTLAQALDSESFLRELVRTVSLLGKKLDGGVPPKSPMNAEEVWAKWRLLEFDLLRLSKREIRSLCVSRETALRPRLVDAITSHSDCLSRASTIFGLVSAYWHKWRTMEQPHRLESLILWAIAQDSVVRRSKVIGKWQENQFLFSPDAANQIAVRIVREHSSPKLVFANLFIEPNTELARQAQSIATKEAVKVLFRNEGAYPEERCLQDLKWIVTDLATRELEHDVFRRAMSELIVCTLPERFPAFRRALTEIVHSDDRMGDPRLPDKAVNWRSLPEEARARFVSWIAGETLQFFFETLVPRNDENRRRADFWLQYIRRGKNLRDFQVAVSSEDENRIRAVRAKTMPAYSRMKTWDTTSAFLMVFQGHGREYVIIEFSETGNAAYIYDRGTFEAKGASMRSAIYDLSRDLKRMVDAKQRIIHIGSWESSAKSRLAELGIRP